MSKQKQHGIAGALGVRKPSTLPLVAGGAFQWGKIGAAHQEKECEGKEGKVARCIADVSKKGTADDPGAVCAAMHDKKTGTTSWRGKK